MRCPFYRIDFVIFFVDDVILSVWRMEELYSELATSRNEFLCSKIDIWSQHGFEFNDEVINKSWIKWDKK